MIIKSKKKMGFPRALLSFVLMAAMLITFIPFSPAVLAIQGNEYHDPAEHWITAGNRTGELDVNANVVDAFLDCRVCGQLTLFRVYRVPEYTRSGSTALNRGVMFSDGTMTDGINRGNTDAGVPGVNATYTGYHFTKNVCTVCRTINGNAGNDYYGFGKDVYNLYDCAAGFMVDLSEKRIEPYNYRYHTEITKSGQYCQFCFGTHGTTTSKQVLHNLNEEIDPQIGNQRFDIRRSCDDCGYNEKEVLTAKTVVASHYGIDIPDIVLMSKNEQMLILDDFDISIHFLDYQTPIDEIMIENLTDNQISTIEDVGFITMPDTNENVILGEILNLDPLISYDENADLLYKIIRQALAHIGKKKDEKDLIKTVAHSKKDIAHNLYEQIKRHSKLTVPEYEVKIINHVTPILQEEYTKFREDEIVKYTTNIPAYEIRKKVIGHYEKINAINRYHSA